MLYYMISLKETYLQIYVIIYFILYLMTMLSYETQF